MLPSLAPHHQRHLHEKGSFVSPDSHLLFMLLISPPEVRLQCGGPPPPKASSPMWGTPQGISTATPPPGAARAGREERVCKR